MQKTAPSMPPRPKPASGPMRSPAFSMAQRIKSEQGAEQAGRYLMAMEPYLAPAERAHIAEQLGVKLPTASAQATPPPPMQPPALPPVQTPAQSPVPSAPPMQNNAPFASGANPLAALGNLGRQGVPMQMLQMLSALGGGNNGGVGALGGGLGNLGNIAQLAQLAQSIGPLLGGLPGGKR